MKKRNRNTVNLIICIAEILIGVLLLIDPVGFTAGVLVVLGIALSVLGITKIVAYFRAAPETAAMEGGLTAGLILTLIGLFCIFQWEWFVATFPILTVIYGVLTLINGINKVQWATDLWRMKQQYWFISMIGAGLTLIFGVLILLNPFASSAFLWSFIAITMIVEAIVDILSFVFGKK